MVLLAVSADGPETRPNIPGFLKKYDLKVKVLLDDEKQLAGYDYSVASSLYVIDRKGYVAGVPSDLFLDRWRKIDGLLPRLIERKPAPGPTLLSAEVVPPGFRMLWKAALAGEIQALTVAPPTGNQSGEIAAIAGGRLLRWSAAGNPLPGHSLEGKSDFLAASDLDGDGRREWIASGERTLYLLDAEGTPYWTYYGRGDSLEVLAVRDVDGDGVGEILLRIGDRIVAKKHLPGIAWETDRLEDLRAIRPDPAGVLLVQQGGKIRRLDGEGRLQGAPFRPPKNRTLLSRLASGKAPSLDLFGGLNDPPPEVRHDLDGDGSEDILLVGRANVSAYRRDGSPILTLHLKDDQHPPQVAVGDLDGKPGVEIVIFVRQYGLVVLGRGPEASQPGTTPDRAAVR